MRTFELIRPSTLLRVVEDGVLTAATGIGRGAKHVGLSVKNSVQRGSHAVRIEYHARMAAAVVAETQRMAELMATMTPEQLAAVQADMEAIHDRAQQLMQEREAKASRRASRTGS